MKVRFPRARDAIFVMFCLIACMIISVVFEPHIARQRPINRLFGPSLYDLPEIGQPLVDALELHKRATGRYPQSLKAAGLEPIDTPYGRFKYEASEDGQDCKLKVGSYNRYLFRVDWTSSDGWQVINLKEKTLLTVNSGKVLRHRRLEI